MRSVASAIIVVLTQGLYFANAQSYFSGKFNKQEYTTNGKRFTLYDFSESENTIKAKFFAHNGYNRYSSWKAGKQVLLVTSAAFSNSWASDAKPVGICMDNGTIVNRVVDDNMDGMAVVFSSGQIKILDLDNSITVHSGQQSEDLSIRTSVLDKIRFLSWGTKNWITVFQSHLVYSSSRSDNFLNLYYGEKRERRFLALCTKNGANHQVIIDAPDELELNLSASYAKATLEHDGFIVNSIINLETGGRNILYVYNGRYLQNLEPNPGNDEAKIEKTTNLLVYYKDY